VTTKAKALGLTKLSPVGSHTPQWRAGFSVLSFSAALMATPALARPLWPALFKEAPPGDGPGLKLTGPWPRPGCDLIAGDSNQRPDRNPGLGAASSTIASTSPVSATPCVQCGRPCGALAPAAARAQRVFAGQQRSEMRRMNAAVDLARGKKVAALWVRRFNPPGQRGGQPPPTKNPPGPGPEG